MPFTTTTSPRTATTLLLELTRFIGEAQMRCLRSGLRGEERNGFAETIGEIHERIQTMPKSYETDGQGDKAVAQLHYFTANGDWYITEKDMLPDQLQAFGFACPFGRGGERGYINIAELIRCGAELDLHWTPKPLSECRK